MSFFIALLYLVFVVSCILLIVVILLQEGKGGGLGEAFGGVGGETFGHKAGGVNRFTATLAGVMIVSAVAIHWFSARSETSFGSLRVPAKVEQPAGPPLGPGDQPPGSQPIR